MNLLVLPSNALNIIYDHLDNKSNACMAMTSRWGLHDQKCRSLLYLKWAALILRNYDVVACSRAAAELHHLFSTKHYVIGLGETHILRSHQLLNALLVGEIYYSRTTSLWIEGDAESLKCCKENKLGQLTWVKDEIVENASSWDLAETNPVINTTVVGTIENVRFFKNYLLYVAMEDEPNFGAFFKANKYSNSLTKSFMEDILRCFYDKNNLNYAHSIVITQIKLNMMLFLSKQMKIVHDNYDDGNRGRLKLRNSSLLNTIIRSADNQKRSIVMTGSAHLTDADVLKQIRKWHQSKSLTDFLFLIPKMTMNSIYSVIKENQECYETKAETVQDVTTPVEMTENLSDAGTEPHMEQLQKLLMEFDPEKIDSYSNHWGQWMSILAKLSVRECNRLLSLLNNSVT